MYHPPVSNETDSEAEAEVDRYMAALGNPVYNTTANSQSTSFAALSLETTETDLTGKNSSMASSITGASSLFGTNSTTRDKLTTNHKNLSNSRGGGSTHKERSRGLLLSMDSEATSQNLLANELQESAEDGDYFRVKQSFGYCATAILAIQLCVLMLQLTLCGVAPLDINPVIGPYPDAFSEWGGKNAYLLLAGREYWRLVTPVFLHVGVLHLLCNAVVQLETCAFFEREWGSKRWMIIYVLSEVGCVVVSCVVNPDTLAVGSSGALMGLFGAKFAQLITYTIFDLMASYEPHIRMDQLSGIMCSLSIISILSFMTYIDWSGHMGGFGTGFCVGMVAFSTPIRSGVTRFVWNVIGLGLLGAGAYYSFRELFVSTEPDEDLADPCNYFRNLYAEGYNCECAWG
jgi:membrane associated rhomboid family serine protease